MITDRLRDPATLDLIERELLIDGGARRLGGSAVDLILSTCHTCGGRYPLHWLRLGVHRREPTLSVQLFCRPGKGHRMISIRPKPRYHYAPPGGQR